MADSSLMPALIGLGGTIVGSAIVLTSQWLLERRKQEVEKKKRKADKLEELISLLMMRDLDEITNSLREHGELNPEIKNKMALNQSATGAIIAVYFPQFVEKYDAVCNAMWDFHEGEKIPSVGTEYYNKFEEFMKNIVDYAKREFQ